MGRNIERKGRFYDKRVCLLKSRKKSADPADLACFAGRFVPRYTYVPSLPNFNLRGRRLDGGGGGVVFWVTPWVISLPPMLLM